MEMKVLMGVGNELRGDDGVGIYVARNLRCPEWKVIVAGQVPEDFTAEIKRMKPEVLILVDAALMGLTPGEIRRVPVDKIPKVAFSTHGMPLSFLMEYLSDYVDKIVLIGIEPSNMEFGSKISEKVKNAAERVIELICKDDVDNIPFL